MIRKIRPPMLGFAAFAALALWFGASAAWDGAPRLMSALLPGMAAQAMSTPDAPVARFALSGLSQSRFAPQPIFPVIANAFPDWMRQRPPQQQQKPIIAICIDDLGEDFAGTNAALKLPRDVMLSFLPYSAYTPTFATEARERGHEVLVHMPMQAIGPADPGPMALRIGMDRDEVLRRLAWSLDRVPGASGINNHEGSRFTSDARALAPVMETLAARHLFFFDSRTAPGSVGVAAAIAAHVPSAGRDVFLDDDQSEGAVRNQLAVLLATARRQGIAIAIGHPHETTLRILAAWLAEDHGVTLVPVSAAINDKMAQGLALASR